MNQRLTAEDRKYLKVMVDIHNCGPVGLKPLALSLETDRENVETCIEPFLVRQKLLRKLPRGRILTELGEKIGRELLEKEECESFSEIDII